MTLCRQTYEPVHEILVLIVSVSNEGASEPAHISEPRHQGDFQQCGIFTSVSSVYSDEPVQPPFKLRNSKWCLLKRLAKALIRLRVCAGWSEDLLVARTALVEISVFALRIHGVCIVQWRTKNIPQNKFHIDLMHFHVYKNLFIVWYQD